MLDSLILYSFSLIFFPGSYYMNLNTDDLSTFLYRHIEYQFQTNVTVGIQSPVIWNMQGKAYGGVSTIQIPTTTKNVKLASAPLSVDFDINIEVEFLERFSVGWKHQCLHPIASTDNNKGIPGVPHGSSDVIFIQLSNM